MKLHSDWRKILTKAWSVRWMVAAAVFTCLEGAFAVYTAFAGAPPLGMPMGVFAGASGAFCAMALVARLMAQKEYGPDA